MSRFPNVGYASMCLFLMLMAGCSAEEPGASDSGASSGSGGAGTSSSSGAAGSMTSSSGSAGGGGGSGGGGNGAWAPLDCTSVVEVTAANLLTVTLAQAICDAKTKVADWEDAQLILVGAFGIGLDATLVHEDATTERSFGFTFVSLSRMESRGVVYSTLSATVPTIIDSKVVPANLPIAPEWLGWLSSFDNVTTPLLAKAPCIDPKKEYFYMEFGQRFDMTARCAWIRKGASGGSWEGIFSPPGTLSMDMAQALCP